MRQVSSPGPARTTDSVAQQPAGSSARAGALPGGAGAWCEEEYNTNHGQGLASGSALRRARAGADNRSTSACWPTYTSHRTRVTEYILSAAPPRPAADVVLCVLGAGNCNDLDLQRLVAVFDRVDLVDIDGAAVLAGVARQLDRSPTIDFLGDIDLTDPDALQHFDGRRFDVVVSTAVLSQLLGDALNTHPSVSRDLIQDVRRHHLCLLSELAKPGGIVLLINDLVSTQTVPGLGSGSARQLPDLMEHLLEQGNFFTGCNPHAICTQLRADPHLAAQTAAVELHRPWIWHMSEQICRLAYVIAFRRVGMARQHQ